MIKKHDPAIFDVSLKVLIKNKKGEVLILIASATKHPPYHGLWDLPGGRINNDELLIAPEVILKREVREEIGNVRFLLQPRPIAIGYFPWPIKVNKTFVLFEANYMSGAINISEEHEKFIWKRLTKTDIKKFIPILRPGIKNYFNSLKK